MVLKSLPRQRPTPPQRNAPAAAPTMDSWTIASQQMVYSLRDRLRATAGAHTTTKIGAPLRLHRNAVPEVNVVMVMPGDAKQFLGDSSPGETKVYYARTTFTPANAKEQQQVLEHYTDRSAGISHPDMQQQLMWIDGVKSTEDGLRRTMDVIIQQTQAAAAPGGEVDSAVGLVAVQGRRRSTVDRQVARLEELVVGSRAAHIRSK